MLVISKNARTAQLCLQIGCGLTALACFLANIRDGNLWQWESWLMSLGVPMGLSLVAWVIDRRYDIYVKDGYFFIRNLYHKEAQVPVVLFDKIDHFDSSFTKPHFRICWLCFKDGWVYQFGVRGPWVYKTAAQYADQVRRRLRPYLP